MYLGYPSLALAGIDYDFQGIPSGIRPYLHNPKPDSMRISWWSDDGADAFVDYGPAADQLITTIPAITTNLGSGYRYHEARITGLTPASWIWYRVRSSAGTSEVFRFRSLKPLGTNTGKVRILVAGDNQILNQSELRYQRLIERAKKKIEDLYQMPIEEAVDAVIMPGDQVDNGSLNHWRNLHFTYNGLISPTLPILTTVGNHELAGDESLNNYKALFHYDEYSPLGVTSPDPEIYYAWQLANIVFVHTSSEHTAGTTQTNWVQNVVNAAAASSSVDWMISLTHRPYQAEQYVGDISGWLRNTTMPILAQTDKHVLNIGAHHHLYARGQTRNWPIYHIISGGSAWDQYWGQSNEVDYDDVQKTLAHWTWQLIEFDLDARTMEVVCYAEANIRFSSATRWSYNSREVDRFSRKLGLAAPATPSLQAVPSQLTLPLTLQSNGFASPAGEALNSTWFQIAADSQFTNPVVDRVRDFENFYGDSGAPDYEPVNTRAGEDILAWTVAANALGNGTWHARVRHRDRNATWSNWSAARSFTVQNSAGTAPPGLSIPQVVFAAGTVIPITYANGPGGAQDWVGIYQPNQTPGPSAASKWSYVNSSNRSHGTLNFGAASHGSVSGALPGGEWYAAFLSNDGYTEIAPRQHFFVGTQPVLTQSKSEWDEGETVVVHHAQAPAQGAGDQIRLYRVGKSPGTDQPAATRTVTAGSASGSVSFANLPKGYYYADYFVGSNHLALAGRLAFSVGELIATVAMTASEFENGASLSVTFQDGPGIPKDYIGLFHANADPEVDPLVAYLYFEGSTHGSVTFELPELPAGNYFVAMFTNDTYTAVSNRVNFTITGFPPVEMTHFQREGDSMRLDWQSVSEATYQVQRAEALVGPWTVVGTVVGTGGVLSRNIPLLNPAGGGEFFRIRRN